MIIYHWQNLFAIIATIIAFEMAPYETLYGRKSRSPLCWEEIGKKILTGPEIIQDAAEKVTLIKRRLEIAASKQKSYADL